MAIRPCANLHVPFHLPRGKLLEVPLKPLRLLPGALTGIPSTLEYYYFSIISRQIQSPSNARH